MKPNILICGKTGTGKSSVINFIFKKEVAEIGHTAEAKTLGISKLYKSDTLNIYDSEGYEVNKQQRYQKIVFDDFLAKMRSMPYDERLHQVWYTVQAAGKRLEGYDIEIIKKMQQEKYPVCVLLTKIDEVWEEQLEAMLQTISLALPGILVFRLCTTNSDVEFQTKYCDFKDLIEWSMKNIPKTAVPNFKDNLNEESLSLLETILGGLLASWFTSAGIDTIPNRDRISPAQKIKDIFPRL